MNVEDSDRLSIEDIIRPIKKAPKIRSDHDIQMILEGTRLIPFFAKYINEGRPDVHRKCCKYMTYESFADGNTVFSQGEKGSKFYVILEGRIGVYVNIRSEMKRVKQLDRGESFGELALVNDEPRSASIKCERNCHFAVLEKKYYINLFKQILDSEIKSNVSFYSQIELISDWNYNKIKAFYNHSFRVNVKKGERIINEGDQIDAVYIITSGEFVATKRKPKTAARFILNQQTMQQQQLRNNTKRMSSVAQHFEQMKLFILSSYEIFGQECVEEEGEFAQTFQYSVECSSFEGSLIHIKLQDYQKVILREERQREYIRQYSRSRLQRLTSRLSEVSSWLNSQEKQQEEQQQQQLQQQQQQLHHLQQQQQSWSQLPSEVDALTLIKQPPPVILLSQNLAIPQTSNNRPPRKSLLLINNLESKTNIPSRASLSAFTDDTLSPQHSYQLQSRSSLFSTNSNVLRIQNLTQETEFNDSSQKQKAVEQQLHKSNPREPSLTNMNDELTPIIIQNIKKEQPEISPFVNRISDSIKPSPSAQNHRNSDYWTDMEDPQQSSTKDNTHFRTSSYKNLVLQIPQHQQSQQQQSHRRSSFLSSPASQELHPLVKGFHEQLKLRFYSKFKNGQISDLKQHLSSYMPIATLQIGSGPNGSVSGDNNHSNSQNLYAESQYTPNFQQFVSRNKKDTRMKEVRAYEAKLRMIIRSDTQVSPESLSPILNPPSLSTSASSAFTSKSMQNLPNAVSVKKRLSNFFPSSPSGQTRFLNFHPHPRALGEETHSQSQQFLRSVEEISTTPSSHLKRRRTVVNSSKSASHFDITLPSQHYFMPVKRMSAIQQKEQLIEREIPIRESRVLNSSLVLVNSFNTDRDKISQSKQPSTINQPQSHHTGFRGQKGFNCSQFNISRDRKQLALRE